jgi:hypothetical protein
VINPLSYGCKSPTSPITFGVYPSRLIYKKDLYKIHKSGEVYSKVERLIGKLFRCPNGQYKRFWNLDHREREYFLKSVRDNAISLVTAYAMLGERQAKYGVNDINTWNDKKSIVNRY